MGKIRTVLAAVLLMAGLLSAAGIVPASAAAGKTKEIPVEGADSGYSIVVPNYLETKKVTTRDIDGSPLEINVIVMETPKKSAAGGYPVFEIVTTEEWAYSADAYPATLTDGIVGSFDGLFDDGRMAFDPVFSIRENQIYNFDFTVYREDEAMLFNTVGLYFMFAAPGTPAQPAAVTAKPTASKVAVNGKNIDFEAYLIGGSNYFKLRDLAMVVRGTDRPFSVNWDAARNAIELTAGEIYEPAGGELAVSGKPASKQAKPTSSILYVNGEEVRLTAYNIGGSNYFKLRDIAAAIDFGVTWDAKLGLVGIDTTAGYVQP